MSAGKNISVEPIAYTLPEAAEAVRLSVDSLQKAIKAGELIPKEFGTKPLIGIVELRRWFDSLPNKGDRVA